MAKSKKGGLGKGLSALIPTGPASQEDTQGAAQAGTAPEAVEGERVLKLDPQKIEPNPHQPRQTFDEDALEELSRSIKQDGVQEPVLVRKVGGHYELVSGERRVRASIMAGLQTIPAICRDVSDEDMLKLGLIENIQREDLNPIELARAYQMLIDEFGWTQEELAGQVGKKRATVANSMRLLNLPGDVQEAVSRGSISMGHARALLALESADAQSRACRKVVNKGLSVRQVEQMATPPVPKKPKPGKDANIAALEDELRRLLGTRVTFRTSGNKRGKIEIEYYSLDDLDRILDVLRSGQ